MEDNQRPDSRAPSPEPQTPSPAPAGRVAGVDFGTVRIGIALSDAGRRIATPLETYARRTVELDARHFRSLAAAEQITLFVVGLPVHLDGRESRKSQEARAFGRLALRDDRRAGGLLRRAVYHVAGP